MPTLLVWRGFKFRFYALDMGEPAHVHVVKDGKSARIWLAKLEVANNKGYSERELAELLAVVGEHQSQWIEAWNEFFGI